MCTLNYQQHKECWRILEEMKKEVERFEHLFKTNEEVQYDTVQNHLCVLDDYLEQVENVAEVLR